VFEMRLLLCVVLLLTVAVLGDPDDYELHLLSNTSEALCLDGSPGGFYLRTPPTPSSSWVIHFEGGGWCTSLQDCAGRAQGDLGSSKGWPTHTLPGNDGGAHGFLSTDPAINPRFSEWNMVRFEYCDGASFAGYQEHPVLVNDSLLYFRGASILQESINALKNLGLDKASEIIITGCSAGGLSVYLHLDWIRSQFPKSVRIVGVPDSGFFMDLPDWSGKPSYTPLYQTVFKMQNATFVNDECLRSNGKLPWKCFFAQYTLPHIKTPLFLINPLVDSWQMGNIIRLPCLGQDNLTNCSSEELAAVTNFEDEMIKFVKPVKLQPSNGLFLYSCVTHCGACTDQRWTGAFVQGVAMQKAVASWYDGAPGSRETLIDSPWPSNLCTYNEIALIATE
jgi:uncharacterized protein YuzB (UPF0349 family)